MAKSRQEEVAMRKSQERSIGTMISTVCFLGLSLVFFYMPQSWVRAIPQRRSLGLCARLVLLQG